MIFPSIIRHTFFVLVDNSNVDQYLTSYSDNKTITMPFEHNSFPQAPPVSQRAADIVQGVIDNTAINPTAVPRSELPSNNSSNDPNFATTSTSSVPTSTNTTTSSVPTTTTPIDNLHRLPPFNNDQVFKIVARSVLLLKAHYPAGVGVHGSELIRWNKVILHLWDHTKGMLRKFVMPQIPGIKKRFYDNIFKRVQKIQAPGSHSDSTNQDDCEDVSEADRLAEEIFNAREQASSKKKIKWTKKRRERLFSEKNLPICFLPFHYLLLLQ